MDGVLANNKQHYLDYYFNETGVQLKDEDILGLPEGACLPDKGAVARYIESPHFFRTLPVSDDAQAVVFDLWQNYDIYIVSAAMEFPFGLRDKYDWLAEHFPFIGWQNIVFCGDKSIVHTDYLIDDHIKNLRTFTGKGLMFDSFHNVKETGFDRLMNWKEVSTYFIG